MYGEIIALLANFVFVLSNVLFRQTEHEVSSIFINLFRTFTGMLTFIIFSVFTGLFSLIFSLPWILWFILILSFVFGQVIGDTAYFNAQKELGATKALTLSLTFPVFTFLLSFLFLGRSFDVKFIFSGILIGIGVLIIAKSKLSPRVSHLIEYEFEEVSKESEKDIKKRKIKAILFGITASLAWAIGLVFIDYGVKEINNILDIGSLSSVVGNIIRFPFAFLLLLLMGWREERYNKINESKGKLHKRISRRTFAFLIIASLLGTSLGVFLYTEAARIAGGTVLSLITTANPLFALPLTYIINKEKISKKGFIGVFLTIIGVILIIL